MAISLELEKRRPDTSDALREMQDQFLASLNHEIRTPLSGMLGMTDLLLETPLDAVQHEYVMTARLCAQNLLGILNAALEFSALSAGTMRLTEAEFNLPETLKQAVLDHIEQADAKGLNLVCTLDEALPESAAGDPLRLREVLSHLIANALKFTTEGLVEVTASAFLDDNHPGQLQLVVAVRDTGAGVPSDKLDAIFESFRQLESGLSRSHSGLGLGLALSRKIVELMSGTIHVESEVGKGSVFTVTIPLRVAFESVLDRAVQRSQPAQILVVEDNDVAQKVVRHMLTRGGYECVCVASGPDAIEAAKAKQYDLVLMDLQLPGMSGIDAGDALRELPSYRYTPIVAFTANSSDEFRSLCAEHGMQGFIAKPVQSHELLSVLADLLVRTPLLER